MRRQVEDKTGAIKEEEKGKNGISHLDSSPTSSSIFTDREELNVPPFPKE